MELQELRTEARAAHIKIGEFLGKEDAAWYNDVIVTIYAESDPDILKDAIHQWDFELEVLSHYLNAAQVISPEPRQEIDQDFKIPPPPELNALQSRAFESYKSFFTDHGCDVTDNQFQKDSNFIVCQLAEMTDVDIQKFIDDYSRRDFIGDSRDDLIEPTSKPQNERHTGDREPAQVTPKPKAAQEDKVFDSLVLSRNYGSVLDLLDDEADKCDHALKQRGRYAISESEKKTVSDNLDQHRHAKEVFELLGLGSMARVHRSITSKRRTAETLNNVPLEQRTKNAYFKLDKAADVIREERNRVVSTLEKKYNLDWDKTVSRAEVLGNFDPKIDAADIVEYETLSTAVKVLIEFSAFTFLHKWRV